MNNSLLADARRKEIGRVGEEVTSQFLTNLGYSIIGRNYLAKWGEIDVIAKKGQVIHFVEVKSVSATSKGGVIHETAGFRPEDNIHGHKVERLKRVIQTYLLDKKVGDEQEWQFDVAVVLVDLPNRLSKIRFIEDIVL